MDSLSSLNDIKSFHVFRTLLRILADLNKAEVWMVSTYPLIFKSFSPCINPLVTVPRAQITIGITVTFMFNSFLFIFQFSSKFQVLILFDFFLFYSVSAGQLRPPFGKYYFLLTVIRFGSLAGIM